VAHFAGAFSEKITRAADDTVLSLISLVVVCVAATVGVAAVYALIQVLN